MQINTSYLTTLNPCEDRLNNWINHYDNFNGSLSEFLDLTEITHQDKLWVYLRSIDSKLIPLVAADFAESVLHVFEEAYPEDKRPRLAIEAARGNDVDAAINAANAAWSAAYAAADAAARAAVDVAVEAAARSAEYAAYAAAHATEYATEYATYAGRSVARAADNQEIKQIEIMKKWIKE